MNRNDILLQDIALQARSGIEIGALDKPIVPPSARIFYVDHLDTPGLIEKYRDDPGVRADKIVQVGGVWGTQTLAEAAAPVAPVDYIVASHVVEHVPNMIGWFNELASVLTDAGEVRLAVPDRRHTFDFLRRETLLAEVLEAHLESARRPSPGRVLDFVIGYRSVDCHRSWREPLSAEVLQEGRSEVAAAVALARDVIDHGAYHDVHCWVFTPRSFAELMAQLAGLGLLRFRCSMFHDTTPDTFEFLVGLQRCADAQSAADSWAAVAAGLREQQESRERAQRDRDIQADPRWRAQADRIEASDRRIAALEDRLTQAERDAATLRDGLADAERRRAELDAMIHALQGSTSWRVTAPLRGLRNLLSHRR